MFAPCQISKLLINLFMFILFTCHVCALQILSMILTYNHIYITNFKHIKVAITTISDVLSFPLLSSSYVYIVSHIITSQS